MGDCWRICVHLNPEREKVTNSSFCHFSCFSFLSMTDHASVRHDNPPLTPSSHSPGPPPCWWGSVKVATETRSGGSAGRRGGEEMAAFSHPRVKCQLWLCEHTHCALSVILCTCTTGHADFLRLRRKREGEEE